MLLAFLVVAIILVSLLVLEFKLKKRVASISEKMRQLDLEVGEYRSYSKYLGKKKRLDIAKSLKSLADATDQILAFRTLLSKQEKVSVRSCKKDIESLAAFLDHYLEDYASVMRTKYTNFFAKVTLDQQQQLAVVKDDIYNLVVAAAGSGKTSVLTTRIAFLVESGVPQEKILALAYTTTAAREMQQRLAHNYGLSSLNIRTFHSFGRELAKQSADFRNDVAKEQYQHNLIHEAISRLSEEREFALLLLQFAVEYQNEEREEDSFPDPQKYYEYMRNQRYTTLNSERVRSVAERDIANFLFLNQVRFKYEDPATWADNNRDYRTYSPDFHLLDCDIWIEHRGIDRYGKVPEWFAYGEANKSEDPSERYQRRMKWSRGQFRKHNRQLVETFHHQWFEGTLIENLKKALEAHAVALDELSAREIASKVYGLLPRRDPLEDLAFSFVSKAKSNGLNIQDIIRKAKTRKLNRRQKAFLSFVIPVWQEYELLLKSNNKIDFADMINLALDVAKKNRNELNGKYSCILIDEFQDITDTQLELIKCIADGEKSHLFCVGDDWQNIFSFAGSNVYNILHFDEHFSFPEVSFIETNYRCPKNVVEISNHSISLNRSQMKKLVISKSQLSFPIAIEEMPADLPSFGYEKWEFEKARDLVRLLLRSRARNERILVLSRYNTQLEPLRLEFPSYESLNLDFLTIHRAKGKEADYVLLLGCVKGDFGFPSEIKEEKLLDIATNTSGETEDKLEEERRLFYVALTRCKKQLYLFTSNHNRSQFIFEITPKLAAEIYS